jgi:hypothetical protein
MEPLEERLKNESVYDSLMDVYSQMGLYRSGRRIHQFRTLQQILSFKIGSIKEGKDGLNEKTTFDELRILEPKYYREILSTFLESILDYDIKI